MTQFSPDAAHRAAVATRYVERQMRNRPVRRARWFRTPGTWHYGKLDSSLAAGAGNYVQVSIWKLNDAGSDWEDTNEDIEKVYAPPLMADGDEFESGTWVDIQKGPQGKWWVRNAACNG